MRRPSGDLPSLALAALPQIDYVSYHLYPEPWSARTVEWAQEWIERHIADGLAMQKPAVLGEFGLVDKSLRNPAYQLWTDTLFDVGGAGGVFWMPADHQDDGSFYPDYDKYTVYCSSPECTLLTNFAAVMNAGRSREFDPIADHDTATAPFETTLALDPLGNDVAYNAAFVDPSTLDLDPAAAGVQSSLAVAGGAFNAEADGIVLFQPDADFSGEVQVSYRVKDTSGRSSNVATITVTVDPELIEPFVLASFEEGTDGFGPASWLENAGTVEQTSAFHTDGDYGLQVNALKDEWFGIEYPETSPLDLTGRVAIEWDVYSPATGYNVAVAIQTNDWAWCQNWIGWTNASAEPTHMKVPLTTFSCMPDLTRVIRVYLRVGPGGPIYLDNIRFQ